MSKVLSKEEIEEIRKRENDPNDPNWDLDIPALIASHAALDLAFKERCRVIGMQLKDNDSLSQEIIKLEKQLAEERKEKAIAAVGYENDISDLRKQLAEARREVERLEDQLRSYEE